MSTQPARPILNADKRTRWGTDRSTSSAMIKDWLAEASKSTADRLEQEDVAMRVMEEFTGEDLGSIIRRNPEVLPVLRALTRRDIGTSQMATFIGIGKSRYEKTERGEGDASGIADAVSEQVLMELDLDLAGWIADGREPTPDERARAAIVVADRMMRRSASTALRYLHEPRQLEKLEAFLASKGYRRGEAGGLLDPRALRAGTFVFRPKVEGMQPDGGILHQTPDAIIMPQGAVGGALPIFIEAKSITDEVNQNKRQKEEAQKYDNLCRRWRHHGEDLPFILLLGGTITMRYLEVEASAGIDWIWEHRVEDLDPLLDWYGTVAMRVTAGTPEARILST